MTTIDVSVILMGVLSFLILYLIKRVLDMDKKLEVLTAEFKHIEQRITQLEKRREADYKIIEYLHDKGKD